MTKEQRRRIEESIAEWSEEMQEAAQIRALEQGFPTIADHLSHLIMKDLKSPEGLNQFLRDHPTEPSQEEFVRKYMEE